MKKELCAFDLPRITLETKYEYEREEILKELVNAPTLLAFYRTEDDESRCLFTGLGEQEYKLFVSQVHRHVPLFEFVKTGLLNIETAREGPLEDQLFMIEAIKYLKLKNKNL